MQFFFFIPGTTAELVRVKIPHNRFIKKEINWFLNSNFQKRFKTHYGDDSFTNKICCFYISYNAKQITHLETGKAYNLWAEKDEDAVKVLKYKCLYFIICLLTGHDICVLLFVNAVCFYSK